MLTRGRRHLTYIERLQICSRSLESTSSSDKQGIFFTLPLRTWLASNLKNSAHSMWSTFFTTAVWWIWKWRNVRRFEDLDFKPFDPSLFIHNKAKEITVVFNTKNPLMPVPIGRVRTESLIQWVAPPKQWIKLNVDGTSKGNPGVAGAGGILR